MNRIELMTGRPWLALESTINELRDLSDNLAVVCGSISSYPEEGAVSAVVCSLGRIIADLEKIHGAWRTA